MYDKVCKSCGRKLSQFYKTSMLGCENCYKAFEQEIASALTKIQGGPFHVGKTPTAVAEDKALIKKYRSLLAEKEQAGIDGRFKDMAEISLVLSELAEELKKRGLI